MAFKVGSLAFINQNFFQPPLCRVPVYLVRALQPSNVWGAMWLVHTEGDETQITLAESFLIPRRGRPKKIENLPERAGIRILDDSARRA
jgi:hypothetical protein